MRMMLPVLVLAGCTSVSATLSDGTRVDVTTFATSRQNIDIAKDITGTHWRATESSPDQTLSQAVLNLTRLVNAAVVASPANGLNLDYAGEKE